MSTFPPEEFLHSCQHRYKSADKSGCGIVKQHTGFDSEILPKQCAQCQYTAGKPSMDFATHRSLSTFLEIMDYVLLGFYGEDQIIEIFEKFHILINSVHEGMSFSSHIKGMCHDKLSNTIEHSFSRNLVNHKRLEAFVHDKMQERVKNFEETSAKTSCPSCDKSFGVFGYVSAKLSGTVSGDTQNKRLDACRACQAVDSKGERLFREIDGKAYCGVPRLHKVYRDEKLDGCGCDLYDKVQYRKSKCPKDVWGHAES